MGDVATPHVTRPVEVLITEPLTTANRGGIARWIEDEGFEVGVPAHVAGARAALLVVTRHGTKDAYLGDRVAVTPRFEIDVVDEAHYKLWYEPVEAPAGRTEP